MKSGLETNVTKAILLYLSTLKPRCKVLKRHMNEYTEAGNPDVEGCIDGRHFEIEVKKPGGQTDAARATLQRIRQDEWERAGALVLRNVTHVNEVKEVIK